MARIAGPVALVVALAVGCGVRDGAAGGGSSAPPAVDGGGIPNADAGSGSGGNLDAGSGGADAGGGGGGGIDADAGAVGGTDGGTAATFPANQDPDFHVVRTGAAGCDGIGPAASPGAPVRLVKVFPSPDWDCVGGATSDGNGDVAFGCQSYKPEGGWNLLYSADASVEGRIAANVVATPLSDGFVAEYTPFLSHEHQLNFTWFDGSAWQSKGYRDGYSAHRFAAHAWRNVLVVDTSVQTTQWHDQHGNALGTPVSWTYMPLLRGVDALGNALVLENSPATAEGELYAGWLHPDDTTTGWTSWRNPPGEKGEPLIGGNLVFHRTTLPGGGAAPAWLQATTGLAMQVVNGGRAYAFARSTPACSEPTVTLYAADGTKCATISVTSPQDPSCAQPAYVGADGTLIQSVRTDEKDPQGNPYTIWRWWHRYLW